MSAMTTMDSGNGHIGKKEFNLMQRPCCTSCACIHALTKKSSRLQTKLVIIELMR